MQGCTGVWRGVVVVGVWVVSVVSVVSVGVARPVVGQVVHYVDAGAAPGGDGTSWSTAFDDLSHALSEAGDGDAIWVAGGTYVPGDVGAAPGAEPAVERSASFVVPSGVSVFGGFAGDETQVGERVIDAHPTVLSGDVLGNDAPGFGGIEENVQHVVCFRGPGVCTLDGLVVSGGNAMGAEDEAGAGVYVDGGYVALRRCTFEANFVPTDLGNGGGALFAQTASLMIDRCVIRNNSVPEHHGGGVMVVDAASVTIVDSVFHGNESDVGAALSLNGVGTLSIVDSAFYGNYAEAGGGGVFAFDVGLAAVTGTTFRNNEGGYTGGGMSLGAELATIASCVFAENFAADHAGGLGSSADTLVVNCVFSRNAAPQGGGAIFSEAVSVVNCTFSGNGGGAIMSDAGSGAITVRNSVLWGNGQDVFHGPIIPDVAFSIVEDGWSGPGNLDADPHFVQAGTDDVRLAFGSPAVDAGDNDAIPVGFELDLAGAPRIGNGTVDLGAHEGAHAPLPPAAMAGDIDAGETIMIVFGDGNFDPLTNTMLIVENSAGPDDSFMAAVDEEIDVYPGAGGYTALRSTLTMSTNLEDGAFHTCIIRPFGGADLGGADPLHVDLTSLRPGDVNWSLAVAGNTDASPGHSGPVGNRIVSIAPQSIGVTADRGDYGVHWDPVAGAGFVWANVDYEAVTSCGIQDDATGAPPGDSFGGRLESRESNRARSIAGVRSREGLATAR